MPYLNRVTALLASVLCMTSATAAAQIPEGDGYLAALINFRFMANAVWTTDEAVSRMDR